MPIQPMNSPKPFQIILTVAVLIALMTVSGCGFLGGGIGPPPETEPDPWTLPPEPSISPTARGDSVCLTQQEMINLTSYVDRLRRKAVENGGIDPEI